MIQKEVALFDAYAPFFFLPSAHRLHSPGFSSLPYARASVLDNDTRHIGYYAAADIFAYACLPLYLRRFLRH